MPVRGMQADDPAALPKNLAAPSDLAGQRPARADEDLAARLATVAGAVSALARQVEQMQAPRVTLSQRREALEQARGFVTEMGLRPNAERVQAEVLVARYLTGE